MPLLANHSGDDSLADAVSNVTLQVSPELGLPYRRSAILSSLALHGIGESTHYHTVRTAPDWSFPPQNNQTDMRKGCNYILFRPKP